jgi:predicted MFS family arabinose efflux permease
MTRLNASIAELNKAAVNGGAETLIDAIGWRSIFFVNVPIGAAAMIVTWAFVDEGDQGGQPIDAIGAALVTLALGALTWSLTLLSNQHGASATAWGGLILGLSLLAGFLVIERDRGEAAMMPLTLFGSTAFAGLTALTFLLYGALGGLLVLLPYLLIEVGHYSPFEAGLALLPFPLIIGVGSRAIGGITMRVGPKWPLGVGPLVTGLGFTLFQWIDPATSYVRGVLPGVLLIALGMAGVVAPLTTAVLSSVDDRHNGHGERLQQRHRENRRAHRNCARRPRHLARGGRCAHSVSRGGARGGWTRLRFRIDFIPDASRFPADQFFRFAALKKCWHNFEASRRRRVPCRFQEQSARKWSERCAFTTEEPVGGPPACPFWAPNNHLSFAINWFKPGAD